MKIPELADKKFKIIILKTLRELQENMDKQFNNIRNTIQEDEFTKETENIKRTKQFL